MDRFSSRNAFRPQAESLDERIVPAVLDVHEVIATGVVTITANNANDTINIFDHGPVPCPSPAQPSPCDPSTPTPPTSSSTAPRQ